MKFNTYFKHLQRSEQGCKRRLTIFSVITSTVSNRFLSLVNNVQFPRPCSSRFQTNNVREIIPTVPNASILQGRWRIPRGISRREVPSHLYRVWKFNIFCHLPLLIYYVKKGFLYSHFKTKYRNWVDDLRTTPPQQIDNEHSRNMQG